MQSQHVEYCCRFRTDIFLDCIDGTCVWKCTTQTGLNMSKEWPLPFAVKLQVDRMCVVVSGSNGQAAGATCRQCVSFGMHGLSDMLIAGCAM